MTSRLFRLSVILLLAAAVFAGPEGDAMSGDRIPAVAVCQCPQGRSAACMLYVRWGMPTMTQCADEFPTPATILSDQKATRFNLTLLNDKQCTKADAAFGEPYDGVFFKITNETCNGNAEVNPNQHDNIDHVQLYVFKSEVCDPEEVELGLYIPEADGSCQAAIGEEESTTSFSTGYIIALVLTPFITAFVGYGTNVIAIKLIFQPYEPRCGFNLGCVKWKGFQGVFPKRKYGLAEQIGEMVDKNLLSAAEMVDKMKTELGLDPSSQDAMLGENSQVEQELEKEIHTAVEDMINEFGNKMGGQGTINAFTGPFGGREVFVNNLTKGAMFSLKKNLPLMMETFANAFKSQIPFRRLITERIRNQMSPADLEEMFMSFMSTELGFVEQLGGILGAMVGVLQSLMYLAQGDPTT
eukprot:TRINITY_DN9061_c0_g1_i2.p1 TRINITY_DN9061_c0_g1~~TRINITY_DN9061_c0_g1_i2.p1  ORF type:complete len:411 (+),score=67.60 TRINITY_DN9061_c0_g1_i2:55-1287(+)